MSRPHLLLLLFVSLPLVLACGSRQTYYKTSVVGVVPVLSPEWVWQQGSMILMSDSQLERMALHARNPAHRVMAFDKLASKRSQRCLDILLANLTDTSSLKVQWFDLTLDTDVSSHTASVHKGAKTSYRQCDRIRIRHGSSVQASFCPPAYRDGGSV